MLIESTIVRNGTGRGNNESQDQYEGSNNGILANETHVIQTTGGRIDEINIKINIE